MSTGEAVQHVFIIGAKSIGQYGGYETFVDKLTEYHKDVSGIKYHIACKANGYGCMDESKLSGISNVVTDKNEEVKEFSYHNAHVFKIHCPDVGPASAIYYDLAALSYSIHYCEEHQILHPIFYVLACRIGVFVGYYKKQIELLGGVLYVNPDGHEWKRAKWSAPVKRYWKLSEKLMVKHADLLICDSINIENYIQTEYKQYKPNTTYIAYGSDTKASVMKDDDPVFVNWLDDKGLKTGEYYLVVGRFVPENNYGVMIREFMKSSSDKNLAIITNVNNKFLSELEDKYHFSKDSRIKFVGTVYNCELLKKIRENAYCYFHGHSVGGTNPSLLEALGSTDLNLLFDVGFNRECAEDGAFYWTKEDGNLSALINKADNLSEKDIYELSHKARKRIQDYYSWKFISDRYENLFLNSAQKTEEIVSSVRTA
ncbi:beta 1-4 rhamnosyltransferase Cps2T [Butyrivibrio sp. MC2013]|uniref:beta 1-4 rhamnosyltransferase Cps2T n=1 Tax=Butyrivibrio sp. MC2013 TaxID=1280686 RepID=UPI00040B2FAF|nr:DUF1972 domain-containing protein [Butyrivibrio sp. MC2013]